MICSLAFPNVALFCVTFTKPRDADYKALLASGIFLCQQLQVEP
jgi:hypothetical protein